MSEQKLDILATYAKDLLGYQDVTVDSEQLIFKIPEDALAAGRAAGSTVTIKSQDVNNCTGQFSWLAEQVKDNCPIVYKCQLGNKQESLLPKTWSLEKAKQLLLIWWNVSLRAVNIQEELLLLPCIIMAEGQVELLPVISPEEEASLLEYLPIGAVNPCFTQETLAAVTAMARDYFTKVLDEKVHQAMAEVEKQRQEQLEKISTYYFLTSKRLQERVSSDEIQQRWQLESLAQDKARLVRQIGDRYAAESVMINISPEVVVLCGLRNRK